MHWKLFFLGGLPFSFDSVLLWLPRRHRPLGPSLMKGPP